MSSEAGLPEPSHRDGQTSAVHTLTGRVSSSELGRVLMHEHVFCRVRPEFLPAARAFLAAELDRAHRLGVRTIVDLTTYVLPDPFLDVVAKSPVRIICCAGYYLLRTVPAAFRKLDASGLADRLLEKCERGIGSRRVLPGILKVATSGSSFTRFERDALKAVTRVQLRTGLPVATHACRGGKLQLETIMKHGGNPARVFLSHIEMELKGSHSRAFEAVAADALWILAQGAYLFFGDLSVTGTPYRRSVIELIRTCCDRGFARQLFLSADCHWSVRRKGVRVRGSDARSKCPRTYSYTPSFLMPLLVKNGLPHRDVVMFVEDNPAAFFGAVRHISTPAAERRSLATEPASRPLRNRPISGA